MEGSEELEKALRVARGRALADTGEPRHEGEERGGKGVLVGDGRRKREEDLGDARWIFGRFGYCRFRVGYKY